MAALRARAAYGSLHYLVARCVADSLPTCLCCRERDTTGQLIGSIDAVIDTIIELVNGTIDWAEACRRLPAYDGVQAVE